MRITYIFHDGFLLDTPDCQIVFDFWKNHPDAQSCIEPRFDSSKPLYIFVSHFHKDHYNPDIFTWARGRDNVKFIISPDVEKRARPYFTESSVYKGPRKVPKDMIVVLAPGESFSDELISVMAFGSTDTGCSWFTECSGKRIFHAGDLNAWIWKDESSEEEVEAAIYDFRKILSDILKATDNFDVVMFPVDSRIGSEYYTGAKIFLQEFNTKFFLPMHYGLGEDRPQGEKFASDASKIEHYRGESPAVFAVLTGPYSSLDIPD